jgi:iron complex outermembrane receptor protein
VCAALGFLLLACPVAAFAQDPSTFQQLVVEVVSDDKPLIGASVEVDGRSEISDDQGRAVLTLAPGEHELTVTANGHLPATSRVVVGSQRPAPVRIALSPIPEAEETVIVTATRTNTRLQDQPVRVEVIDREEIEEKALMTPGSVAMLLGETTGLRVQTTSPALGAANVRIQGLRGRYSQLVADGLPLYGAQ